MTTWLHYFQLMNALLCLLLAAQLFLMSALRPIPKRLLGINYLLYAHQSIILIASLNDHVPHWFFLRPIGAMLIGPFLYLYFACVQRPGANWQWKDIIHPLSGLILISLLVLIRPLRALIDYAILTSFSTYLIFIALKIRSASASLSYLGNHASTARQWLFSLFLMALINLSLEIAVIFEMQQGTALKDTVALFIASCSFLFINTLTILAALSRSHWLEWMYEFEDLALQRPNNIDFDLAQALFQRWESFVNTDQPHLREFGITLPQAAKKLQVPARQLSNTINQVYGKSFSVYLNDLRICNAQSMLREKPGMPIIAVMQESGFISKSNFNKEFLRVTGMSPSAFREASIKNSEKLPKQQLN